MPAATYINDISGAKRPRDGTQEFLSTIEILQTAILSGERAWVIFRLYRHTRRSNAVAVFLLNIVNSVYVLNAPGSVYFFLKYLIEFYRYITILNEMNSNLFIIQRMMNGIAI